MSDSAMVMPGLPTLKELTEAERRWLAMRLQRLRDLSALAISSFAEAVVAELLPGSAEARDGTARVDISWQPDPTPAR